MGLAEIRSFWAVILCRFRRRGTVPWFLLIPYSQRQMRWLAPLKQLRWAHWNHFQPKTLQSPSRRRRWRRIRKDTQQRKRKGERQKKKKERKRGPGVTESCILNHHLLLTAVPCVTNSCITCHDTPLPTALAVTEGCITTPQALMLRGLHNL